MTRPSVVHSDPDILGGTPVFVGTRVPVQALIDYLEGGHSLEEFLDDFPTVTREQAIAALEQAKAHLIADARAFGNTSGAPLPSGAVPMNRRRFGVGLGAVLLLASPAIRAQKAKPRIALPLPGASGPLSAKLIGTLKEGMREQGYPDDSIEYDVLYADGQISRQERIVAELVARNPDAIVVISPPFVRAALKVTRTIPVVMANVSDPVGNGFVSSLARPGGNVTGIATLYETILPKLAELLHELVPSAARVAVLLNENNPSTAAFWQSVDPALRALGVTPVRLNASSEAQIVDAFGRMKTSGVQAAIVVTDNAFVHYRDRIAALAEAAGIPSVYGIREHVVAGGLASYGPSVVGNYRASARYVAKILKGSRAADLPVEQPTRFEMVINRKAADALGIRIPTAVLLRADEVIE